MGLGNLLHRGLRSFGFDLVRYTPESHPRARRAHLLRSLGIDLVFDAGADTSRFARELRMIGYKGRIVSFEPLSSAFTALSRAASSDKGWEAHNCALGHFEGVAELGAVQRGNSRVNLSALTPQEGEEGGEQVVVRTLEGVFSQICSRGERVYLRIGSRGFERHVLEGGRAVLSNLTMLQLELSLLPQDQDELSFGVMHTLLEKRGYRLVSLEPGYAAGEGEPLLKVHGLYSQRQ